MKRNMFVLSLVLAVYCSLPAAEQGHLNYHAIEDVGDAAKDGFVSILGERDVMAALPKVCGALREALAERRGNKKAAMTIQTAWKQAKCREQKGAAIIMQDAFLRAFARRQKQREQEANRAASGAIYERPDPNSLLQAPVSAMKAVKTILSPTERVAAALGATLCALAPSFYAAWRSSGV